MATHDGPIGPFPPGRDIEEYDRLRRRVLWKLPSGLYLLGARDEHRRNLMTCNLVSQVSLEPKFVGVSVEKHALTYELIEKSKRFALSILGVDDRALVRKFVKPAVDDEGAKTLNGVLYRDAPITGSPVVESAVAYLDFELRETVSFTSHSLFIGEVVDAAFLSAEDTTVLEMHDTRMNYGG